MKRDTRTAYRARAAATERSVDEAVAEVKAAEDEEREAAKAEYAAKHAPVPYTPEELATARLIRTRYGWYKVVRINAKTVTVNTPYSWSERFPLTNILEVKQ